MQKMDKKYKKLKIKPYNKAINKISFIHNTEPNVGNLQIHNYSHNKKINQNAGISDTNIQKDYCIQNKKTGPTRRHKK
jgi:hypothetical protein